MNDLWEEFQAKKVGVFAVCGQPKEDVDLMMSEHNLKFKVHVYTIIPLDFSTEYVDSFDLSMSTSLLKDQRNVEA